MEEEARRVACADGVQVESHSVLQVRKPTREGAGHLPYVTWPLSDTVGTYDYNYITWTGPRASPSAQVLWRA